MLSFALFTIALNVITVAGIFVWVWFIAGKNKVSFGEKLGILDKKIDGIDGEMSMSINTSNHFNESLLTDLKIIQVHINDLKLHIQEAKKESEEAKEVSKKVSDQHEDYHDLLMFFRNAPQFRMTQILQVSSGQCRLWFRYCRSILLSQMI